MQNHSSLSSSSAAVDASPPSSGKSGGNPGNFSPVPTGSNGAIPSVPPVPGGVSSSPPSSAFTTGSPSGSGSFIAVPLSSSGSGISGQPALASSSAAHKRGSFTMLDSSTQSPSMYREKVKNLQESSEHLWKYLRKIADTSRSLAVSGSVGDAVQFADELLEFAFARNDQKEGGILSQNLKNIGSALKDLETMRSTLMEQLENIVTIPLEQFLQVDIKGALEMKKRLVKTRDQYEAAQLKYDLVRTSKKKKDQAEKSEKLETELAELKKLYELTNINYANRLSKIDAKKSFEVLERLGTYMYATMAFFHQGSDLLADLEPSLRELMMTLDEERTLYLTETLKQDAGKKAPLMPTLEKQGYLFVRIRGRSGGMRWKRRWFVVAEGGFHTYRSWKELNPVSTHDMLLSTVKTLSESEPPHKNFVFSLMWPNKEALLLQAASEKDRSEWMEVLLNASGYRLKQSQIANTQQHTSALTTFQRPYEQLRALSEANRFCADCNQKDPEWSAVNLGALLCEECAGVHRGLGVHISRVKSLVLDKWEPELLMLMKSIGNAMANSIWEFNASPALKPNESSDRETRERYIKAKYELRRFTHRPEISTQKLQEQLLEAVLESDVVRVYHLLAQGASLDYQDANKKSVLHHAVEEDKTNLFCLELLVQSGAKVNMVDDLGRSPLHYAALHDRASVARLLMNRGAQARLKDAEGKSPEDLANEFHCRNYQSLMNDEFEEKRKRRTDRLSSNNPVGRGHFATPKAADAAPTRAFERMRTMTQSHAQSQSFTSLPASDYTALALATASGRSGGFDAMYHSLDEVALSSSPKPQHRSGSNIVHGSPAMATVAVSPQTAPNSATPSVPSGPPQSPRSLSASTSSLGAGGGIVSPGRAKLLDLKQALALEIGEVNERLELMKSSTAGARASAVQSDGGEQQQQKQPPVDQHNGEPDAESALLANKLRVVKMLLFHEYRPKEKKEQSMELSEDRETDSEDTTDLATDEDFEDDRDYDGADTNDGDENGDSNDEDTGDEDDGDGDSEDDDGEAEGEGDDDDTESDHGGTTRQQHQPT